MSKVIVDQHNAKPWFSESKLKPSACFTLDKVPAESDESPGSEVSLPASANSRQTQWARGAKLCLEGAKFLLGFGAVLFR